MSAKGRLFLIPTYLDPSNGPEIIAPMVKDIIAGTDHFLVEQVRTARRYISSLNLGLDISALHFSTLDKATERKDIQRLMAPLLQGEDMGLMSEAGMPGIADPGRLAVDYAHQKQITVVPLPGPSSIIQALIASGMDGQRFTFHGYLPIERRERIARMAALEKEVRRTGVTQIFMETPYRNDKLLDDLLTHLAGEALLCIASCITGSEELIRTQSVKAWKSDKPNLHKKPTIFCLGSRP